MTVHVGQEGSAHLAARLGRCIFESGVVHAIRHEDGLSKDYARSLAGCISGSDRKRQKMRAPGNARDDVMLGRWMMMKREGRGNDTPLPKIGWVSLVLTGLSKKVQERLNRSYNFQSFDVESQGMILR